jgi:peptidoglycan hydrolase CwlO-like protein
MHQQSNMLLQTQDVYEENFWPSFSDVMMVILMTFLLVTVAVLLSNTRLLQDLRSNIAAKDQARQVAASTLKENATLEEQLDYYKRQLGSTETELMRSQELMEQTQATLKATQTELKQSKTLASNQAITLAERTSELSTATAASERLQTELTQTKQAQETETTQLRTELQQAQNDLGKTKAENAEKETVLATLRTEIEENRKELESLEGDYSQLDEKYQKLLKPSRSSKGKKVAEVMYTSGGYSLRKPGDANYQTLSLSQLNTALNDLKLNHGTDLYVKIVIPSNSGLSYNQAWAFTRDTLAKYDYYYQDDKSVPAAASEEE